MSYSMICLGIKKELCLRVIRLSVIMELVSKSSHYLEEYIIPHTSWTAYIEKFMVVLQNPYEKS